MSIFDHAERKEIELNSDFKPSAIAWVIGEFGAVNYFGDWRSIFLPTGSISSYVFPSAEHVLLFTEALYKRKNTWQYLTNEELDELQDFFTDTAKRFGGVPSFLGGFVPDLSRPKINGYGDEQ